MNRKGTRLLFRKSDRVLLEFKTDGDKVEPSRGIRLDEGNIADFAYSRDHKFVFCITDDGVLRFRSKKLDKDYIIDSSRPLPNLRRSVLQPRRVVGWTLSGCVLQLL